MLNDIYNKRIIELAGNIPRLGRLDAPDASATAPAPSSHRLNTPAATLSSAPSPWVTLLAISSPSD